MSIPAGMMPGAGGPPPAPGGGGGLGPEQALSMLSDMQSKPPQDGEEEVMRAASQAISTAYGKVAPRSAKAAKALSHALQDIQVAREAMKDAGSGPTPAPPDLGFGGPGGLPAPAPMFGG